MLLRWLPAVAWMGVIFLLSSQSGLRVSEDASIDRPLRTLAHLATFALLAGLILLALVGRERPTLGRALLALALTVLYATSDELHQSLVPDRTGRAEDVVVDALGALMGLVAAVLLLDRRDRRRDSVDGPQGRSAGLHAEGQHTEPSPRRGVPVDDAPAVQDEVAGHERR